MTAGSQPVGRRERVRAATVEEIKATARRILVEQGPQAVTLRAIAREMGMTAPGLYRYFPSHEELWKSLCDDIYDGLSDTVDEARRAVPESDPAGRLMAAATGFRSWAIEHPHEFGLIFGMPLPGVKELASTEAIGGMRFAAVFTTAFADLWRAKPFPVPDEAELPPRLAEQLRAYRDAVTPLLEPPVTLPVGAILRFLQAWVQLYGVVTMEVFGHLGFCLDEVGPFFAAQLRFTGAMLGMPEPG